MITLNYEPGEFTRQFELPVHPYTPTWSLGEVVCISPVADANLPGVLLTNINYGESTVTADLVFPGHLPESSFDVFLDVEDGSRPRLAIRANIGGAVEEED
ncbi:MAG: hypothetical protein OXU20_29385 [Myxococcales bacterium]|nr:hypothetical protein [Myxococcales bacterium]MDD9970124.1 hypothetical protein [Myxococcales bacterium]